jgi:hypothetical protein
MNINPWDHFRDPSTAKYTTQPPETINRVKLEQYLANEELVAIGDGLYVRGGGVYELDYSGKGPKAVLQRKLGRATNFYVLNGWCTLDQVLEVSQAYTEMHEGIPTSPLEKLTLGFKRKYGFQWHEAPRVQGSEPWYEALQAIRAVIDARVGQGSRV